MDVDFDPRSRVGDLRLAERQFLEVVKASWHGRVLLLDEPTTALGIEEVDARSPSSPKRSGAGRCDGMSHRPPRSWHRRPDHPSSATASDRHWLPTRDEDRDRRSDDRIYLVELASSERLWRR